MPLIDWAVGRFAVGADPTDMLHRAAARATDACLTFDQNLPRQAVPDSPARIEPL